jgi:hypothetical protein
MGPSSRPCRARASSMVTVWTAALASASNVVTDFVMSCDIPAPRRPLNNCILALTVGEMVFGIKRAACAR